MPGLCEKCLNSRLTRSETICPNLDLFQPVFQVVDNILPVLQANGEPNATGFDSFGLLKFWRQRCMCHRRGVFNQSFYLPQAYRQSDRIRMVGDEVNEFFSRFIFVLSVFL